MDFLNAQVGHVLKLISRMTLTIIIVIKCTTTTYFSYGHLVCLDDQCNAAAAAVHLADYFICGGGAIFAIDPYVVCDDHFMISQDTSSIVVW